MAGIFEQLEKQNNGRMTPASLRRDVQQRFKNAPFKYNYDQSMYDQIQQEELNKDNDTVGNGAIGHFIDSAQAGAASMAGGVLRFGSEYSPIGQDAFNAGADYFDDIVRRNTPTQELSGLDYIAAAAGNAAGSGLASMAMGYALLGIAGAAGLGGSVVAAVGTAAAQSPKLAAAANFLSKIPMTKTVASAVSKINGSKLSMLLASQIAGSPMEAMSEGGNLIQEMRQEGYSDDEIAAAGLKSFGLNTVWLTLMNSLEGATIEKLATKLAAKEGAKLGFKGIAKQVGVGAITKGISEGSEEFGQNVIGNLAEGVPINWEEAKEAGIQGAVGAAVLGGVGGPIAPYLAKQNKAKKEAVSDAPAPAGAAAEQPKIDTSKITPADARVFLKGYRDSESTGAEYAEIDEILDSGDEAAIVKKAAELGFGQTTQATSATPEPPKPVEAPTPAPAPAAPVEQPATPPVTPPVETPTPATPPTPVKPPTPAEPPVETPPVPVTPEAAPWNGEKVKIGKAELSPIVSDDGEKIIFKSSKALTREDKKAMKANGFVWDGNRQAYAGPNTPEGRKWLGSYTVAGTQSLESRQEELGDYKLESRKGELKDSARYISKTNPENSVEITRMSEGSYHVDFYKGKKPAKDARIFKTLAEAEQFVAGYKEEAVKPKEKLGGFNFVEHDKETGLTWFANATNPDKLALVGKDKKGFKAVVFNKGEVFKDKFQKFKTLEEAEAYIANYKDETPVENIKEEGIKEEGVKEENVKEEAPAGEGTPDNDNSEGNTGEPVKPIKSVTPAIKEEPPKGSELIKEEDFYKKKFNEEVGKYVVDEYEYNTDNVHNYLHSDDDGGTDSRWLTIAKGLGNFVVSMGYVGGVTEKTAEFATLDEAEQYVKDNDLPPKAKEVKDDGGKENTDKDNGNEDKGGAPEPKPIKTTEADDEGKGENGNSERLEDNTAPPADDAEPDGNGITPLVKGMGVEAKNARIAKNDEALVVLAEKAKQEYNDGTLTAKGARELISTYVALYNKGGSLKPVSKEALSKLAEIRKSITALEKEKANAPKLEAKKATEDAIAAGEQLVKEACDRIIADEKKPLDEDVWMEATKTTNEKLEAAGLKPLSKTKQQDLERKYRMMLADAKKEAIKVNNQYHDIRSMFDAEAKNIYNSVRDGKLDAQKGLDQYNKLKEKFEADINAINRKADRYVREQIYDRTEKFLNEMLDPKSALPHYLNLERAFEKAENWFRDAIRYVEPKDFARPWLDTEGQRKIKEYEKLYQDAYDEYKKAVDGLGTEYNEKAAKLYQKAKDSWNAIVDRRYPADYIRYLANVVEYDDKATAIIEDYKNKNIDAKEAMAQLEKLNADFADTFNKVTGKEGYFKNFFAENMKAYYTEGNFDYASQKNIDTLKAAIEERGDSLTPSNPTSLEGNNFGEYTDSIMGAGTIEAIFGGTNVIKERVTETPNPKDQAIVDAMVEEKVTDDADKKDPIEGDNIISKIDNIIAAKKDSRTTDYFRKHYDVKLEIKEALEKGVTGLYYTKYVSKKDGKAQYEYFYKLVSDDKRRPMKAVAIRVLAELAGNTDGPMKITELNKKEDNAQQKEKYLKELPSDEESWGEFDEWLYKWYGDEEDLDIYSIIGILKAKYTKDNPCPLNSLFRQKHETIINELWGGDWTFKSLGDAVRKAFLINKAYGDYNENHTITLDGEAFESLSAEQLDAVEKYISWWEQELDSNPNKYPIEPRFGEEITEEATIPDESLNKKVKSEAELYEEDFREETADEADADAEANLAKAEEFAKKVAVADALDKAKAKQKKKIAKAEKEGKRVSEEATVSEEEAARIKAAKAEALAALNVATDEINALYKADSNEQVPLENFKSSIIKQIVHAGYIVMKNAGQKLYKGWRSSMEELVDSMKGLKDQGKAYAKRVLDSAWDFITSLPETVSFAADKLKDTLDNIGMALDIALAGNDRGFGQKETEAMLQTNNQPLYNRVKDYLASAFKALVRYPRRGIDNSGGGNNVNVRTTEQLTKGDSGRGNGVGLEANTGDNGRGSQMGSGTPTDGQTEQEIQVGGAPRGNTKKTSSNVSGGGPAAVGEQSDNEGGQKEPNDKTSLPRGTNEGGSGSSGNGRNEELPSKRAKNNRNVSKSDAGAQGNDAAPTTISELRQQFDKSPFKPADEKGIAEAVPNLLPEQIQDEVAIERRLWTNNGKGMLVANGTGTGKTVVGLAQVVRCIQKGAKKILIVVPNSTVKDRWVDDAQLVGLPKDVFATITSGEVVDDKINFVSYKSFSDNKNILDQSWDFVIMDEAHTVSGGQDNADYIGFRTQNAQTLRAITGHERTGFDDYMWSKYRDKYNRLYGKDGLVEAEAQAFKDLNTSLNSPAAGQDLINENRAKHAQLKKELDALTREIEVLKDKELPKYEKRLLARKEDTRVLLLSATPFAYGNNIYYAEGLLFNYEKDYNDFMVEKLGYVLQDDNNTVDIRRNMDKSPNPDHDAEVRFHDELIKSGAMINRRLEVPQDYNRRFIKVNGGIGQEIDAGFDYINEKYSAMGLNKAFVDHFKYASLCRLLEAIKAEAAIPMIREYVKQGKKVVLFHDYIKDVKIPHPFVLSNVEQSKLSDEARAAYKKFCEEDEEGKRLQALPFNGAKLADKIIEEAFGSSAVIVNGDVAAGKRKARVDAFNNADSGVNIISVSTAAGKEGISLHDKTKDGEGNSLRSVPRVLINIGMPTKPTDAIQTEGRIYRLGQQSNAMFRYLYTDTYTERQAYTKYISTRTSTVEHLALGSQARNLEATFSYGYLESLGYETSFNAARDTMNTGGKALDSMSDEEVNATLKKIRKALSGKKGLAEETLAKLDKQIQDLDDRINEQKRSEILTPENEAKTVNAIKNAVNGGKVTKNRDGVYVVALPNGMNLWFDLNESQAAILSRMSDEQKKRMMSAHDIRNSGYVIRGAYTQKYMPQYDGIMNLVKLTEAATQHTVDHEVYHFVQKMLLSPSELAKVMDYWKYKLKKDIGADAYNQLSDKEILDRCLEMDADMHANFMAYERKPKNFIERVAWKVTKWLANFANKFGIDTPAGMYLRTASGEMFARKGNQKTETFEQYPVRFQAAGVKAKTANLDRLSGAEKMEKQGKSREEIFDTTGWWRAEDDKWRFEIKDDVENIDLDKLAALEIGEGISLEKLYNNPELFKAYPKLKNIIIKKSALDFNTAGGYNPVTNEIELAYQRVDNAVNAPTEGVVVNTPKGKYYITDKNWPLWLVRSDGGESYGAALAVTRINRLVKKEMPLDETLRRIEQIKRRALERLNKRATEEEKEDIREQILMYESYKPYLPQYKEEVEKIPFPYGSRLELFSTIVHEIQHAVQTIEGHASGGNYSYARNNALEEELALKHKIMADPSYDKDVIEYYKYDWGFTGGETLTYNERMDHLEELKSRFNEEQLSQYYGIDRQFTQLYHNKYLDIAGEREARQASARLTNAKHYPWDNLDELRTGAPLVLFEDGLPSGEIRFSITPMDEVDGKGMPDDLKNVTNAPESVGESVDSKATKKDLDKLLTAKMMRDQGKTSEEIFEKTGWWRDKNGNWSLTKPKDSGEKPSKDTKKPYNWQKPNLDKATETGDNNTEPTLEAAQEPKQYKNVDEVMEDAQKNADDAKTTGEIRVKDTSMTPREKNKTVGFFDSLIGSPSELAKKYPVFRSFYRIYQKAEEVQEKLRSRWRKQFQADIAELKSNDDMDAYLDIMLDGELKQKEYTLAELKEQGIADNVARAYTRTRQLIRNIWEAVNDAHRGVTVRIDKLSGKAIKELKEKPFEENIMVRESSDAAFVPLEKFELKDDVEYEVKHSRPHVYRSQQTLTKEQLDALRNSPYANVSNVEEHKVKGIDAVMYRANIERVAAPIGKITGYLPHIFEQWLVMVNTDEGPQIVGSGQSLDLALQEAKRLKGKTKGNVDFYIAPKIFDPSGVYDGDVADGKKGNPNITLSAQDFAKLEKSLRDTFNLSMAEAEEALGKVARRESRSRFLGNLRYRKGRVGYNSDVINTLDRYISMTSRYVALQPAKRRAVNLFERTFGPLDKDYSGKDSMAVTVRRYMRYCNGTPNFLESWITSQLNKMDWWRKHVSSQYGDRTLMALAGKANGLLSMSLLGCFNISSAVVGLTQLINTYGLIGGRYLGEGMAAVQRMNLRDKRILTEAGIPYNIGLDTPSGFTKRREGIDSANAFGNMRRMLSYAGNKGMYFFKQADRLTRNATTLGAYYKAIADGKTHKQAIEYAKGINRRANFSYGAADAAGLFQWTAGTGFGELSLLFQKYPMKEWELMKSMMPIIGSSTKVEKARFWGAYFLMSGLAGIPAGEWLDWLIETLFGVKPSAAFKSVLFKEYGDTPFTRTVAYGIGANVGVDISRRVGMANMIPDSASMWGYLFGPAGNITERMIRSAASQDYTKAIKALSPVMGNLAEAVIHGYSTNNKGQINYMYNDVEKVLKSMGFRTVGESMDSDLRTAVYLDKQSRKNDRQKVMMEMVKKRIDGEALTSEDYKALREQGITGAQFQKAVKAAKMTALQRTRAGMTKQQKKDFAGTLVMEEDE